MLGWKSIDLWVTKELRDGLHTHQLGINRLSWRWAKCIKKPGFQTEDIQMLVKQKNWVAISRACWGNMPNPLTWCMWIDSNQSCIVYMSLFERIRNLSIQSSHHLLVYNLIIYPSPVFSPRHAQGYHPKPRAELRGPLNSRPAAEIHSDLKNITPQKKHNKEHINTTQMSGWNCILTSSHWCDGFLRSSQD